MVERAGCRCRPALALPTFDLMDFALAVPLFIIAVLSLDAASIRWGFDSRHRSEDRPRR